ncbi:MAG: hypothetical protein COW16_12670 [Sphingomonadales bacterium CG12_big_fil_rev_8_21_14_0_65_65_10]|uniref:DUF58 domain-containing protein n=1 Tax=Blastomonas marina TaxID=1867408 RepID=A0ABQ1FFC0_9SPHN|nr:hypothetical protein [Blastomonas marina]PIW54093.1 MAG: hypothetical protein COW16_12670 [Sphingomonadales bacterium CG12_big_fil_rev_8_21_14_0_65_65_10]WPZ02758.1 hypothetical protein T8S45_07810 [Blastomonas marina]GGA08043.1 hypothetical protein GCM10010923_17700 [Blastomonas marina]
MSWLPSLRATGRTTRRLSAWQVFRMPLLLMATSLGGLVAGLLGEGGWDIAAALLLGTTLLTLIALRLTGRG